MYLGTPLIKEICYDFRCINFTSEVKFGIAMETPRTKQSSHLRF